MGALLGHTGDSGIRDKHRITNMLPYCNHFISDRVMNINAFPMFRVSSNVLELPGELTRLLEPSKAAMGSPRTIPVPILMPKSMPARHCYQSKWLGYFQVMAFQENSFQMECLCC